MKLPPAFKDWTEAERRQARILMGDTLALLLDRYDSSSTPTMATTINELCKALDVPAKVAA